MRIFFLSVLVFGVALEACSTFGSEDGSPDPKVEAPPGADAGASPADAAADVTPTAPDAAPVDPGCPDASVTADFATKPSAPFTASSGATFTSGSDATGPYGRFVVTPLADGGVPPDQRYFVAIDPNAVHLCASVRVRVTTPPPEGVVVNELTEVLHGAAGEIGVVGSQAIGSTDAIFAGWAGVGGSGPGSPSTTVPGVSSGWHLTRIELDRAANKPWRATSIRVDGVERLTGDVAAFPSGATFASGEVGIGPQPQSAVSATAPPITIDYADFRLDAR